MNKVAPRMILTISQKLLRKRVSLIHSAQPAIYIYIYMLIICMMAFANCFNQYVSLSADFKRRSYRALSVEYPEKTK